MSERIGFITYQNKQILLIDLSNCSAAEVEKVFRAVPDVVTTHPRNSLLTLFDFTGASFDLEAIRIMKETVVFDKPDVKKSAWTGKPNLSQQVSENLNQSLKTFSRREFHAFETREKALKWLVKD
jgi:hypothetical protein